MPDWRMVCGKAGHGNSQGSCSLKVFEPMAMRVNSTKRKIMVAFTPLSMAYCLQISVEASIKGVDLVHVSVYV